MSVYLCVHVSVFFFDDDILYTLLCTLLFHLTIYPRACAMSAHTELAHLSQGHAYHVAMGVGLVKQSPTSRQQVVSGLFPL